MTKYLLFLVAVAGLIFSNIGCTSKKAEESEQIVENADVEKIEADGLAETAQGVDSSLEAAMGETPSATPPAEVASAAPTLDETSLDAAVSTTTPAGAAEATTTTTTIDTGTATPPSTATTELAITETPTAPIEATVIDTQTPTAVAADGIAPTVEAAAATTIENLPKSSGAVLKKISTTMPYQGKDGGWINTVYIARPKEKLDEISMKIYGTDKSKELKNIAENSYLKSRAVKAGDKIYYVSPNRPDDSSKTMLYYEDMGMIPETYVAKKGENLRKVSKKLLGYDSAWREVWTSNSVESKSSLKDGETLRYWKAAGESALAAMPTTQTVTPPSSGATLIDSAQAPPEMTAQMTPPSAATDSSLPPPPAEANALPPPPADAAVAAAPTPDSAAATATDSSLPPPPAELAAPPPPPPEAMAEAAPKKKVNLDEAAEEESEGLDSDTMMSMAALGVLVALMAFVIIRKKKQKAEQMANSEMNA